MRGSHPDSKVTPNQQSARIKNRIGVKLSNQFEVAPAIAIAAIEPRHDSRWFSLHDRPLPTFTAMNSRIREYKSIRECKKGMPAILRMRFSPLSVPVDQPANVAQSVAQTVAATEVSPKRDLHNCLQIQRFICLMHGSSAHIKEGRFELLLIRFFG